MIGVLSDMKVFITGTDSHVGKTWVGCALARALKQSGKHVIAIKPIETGCSGPATDKEDGVQLAHATGQAQPSQAILRFAEPVAPVLASERTGTDIDFDSLVLKIERFGEKAGFLLFEGVGGLLTPITWEWNMADVASSLGAAALVVAVDRLGAINHTLLTLSAIELAGIPCIGIVLTKPEEEDRSTGSNAAAIARLSGIDRVLTLTRVRDQDDPAERMAQVVSWLARVPVPT
jgi:dethiobiotin synthetase